MLLRAIESPSQPVNAAAVSCTEGRPGQTNSLFGKHGHQPETWNMKEARFGGVMEMVVRVGVILFLFMENKQKNHKPQNCCIAQCVYIKP